MNRKCRAGLMPEQAKSEESNRTDHPATDRKVVATAAAPGNESLTCTATHPTALYRSNSARCYAFKRLDEPRRLAFGPGQKEGGSAGPASHTSQRPVRCPPRVTLRHDSGQRFGEALVEIARIGRKAHFLAVDLPHNDSCHVKAYPAETTEAFCDRHNAAFALFGGVSRSVLYDNTKLAAEIRALDAELARLTAETAPALLQTFCVGPDTAATLLITAGDNPERLRSEPAFAALCGVSPILASSGKTNRHRLNRGGDRRANAALHRVVIVRLRHDERTRRYMARRVAEGMTKAEVIRCLKRYLARELFAILHNIAQENLARAA